MFHFKKSFIVQLTKGKPTYFIKIQMAKKKIKKRKIIFKKLNNEFNIKNLSKEATG